MAHSVENYATGGGIVYITNLRTGSTFDAGNCSKLTVTPKVTWLEHKDSRSPFQTLDRRVASYVEMALKMTLDEIGADQLAIFFNATEDAGIVSPMMAPQDEFYVRFVPDYASGTELEAQFWRVSFGAGGDYNFISMNAWNQLELDGTILDDITAHATARFGKLIPVTA
jgi:hypothetical protein